MEEVCICVHDRHLSVECFPCSLLLTSVLLLILNLLLIRSGWVAQAGPGHLISASWVLVLCVSASYHTQLLWFLYGAVFVCVGRKAVLISWAEAVLFLLLSGRLGVSMWVFSLPWAGGGVLGVWHGPQAVLCLWICWIFFFRTFGFHWLYLIGSTVLLPVSA